MAPTKQNYYVVLGLTSDASDNAIRVAYKKLALQWHPDRHLVGKERAAQKFIEVNQAYHALMDGKESTHSSSSADTSSTTSATASTEATHSDSQTKNTSQASSRPPSASSNSSKRSTQPSTQSSPSKPSDSRHANTSKPKQQSTAPPSASTSSQSSSSHDRKSDSHLRHDKPSNSDDTRPSSDRRKSGQKVSKSQDHRDPPGPGAPPNASSASRSSEGLDASVRSKFSEKTTSSSQSTKAKRDSRPDKTSRGRSTASHSSKPVIPPPSGRLHKSPKFNLADEFVQKLSKGTAKAKKERHENLPYEQESPPSGTPLHAINTPRGVSKEWIFPLALTLDEMYHGTSYRFLVTRELLSRQREQVEISIDIPPGMRSGTRIVCPRTGHQRKDGTLQDIVFLVEEVPDERFSRVKDDLFMDVCVPWADALADEGGELCINGIDGKEITFILPYPIYNKATEGQVLVKGAGMPIRDGRKTVGRGDMIVRWRVMFPPHHSKWETFKKALHLDL